MNNKKVLQKELVLLNKLKQIINEQHQDNVENMIQEIQEELSKYEK